MLRYENLASIKLIFSNFYESKRYSRVKKIVEKIQSSRKDSNSDEPTTNGKGVAITFSYRQLRSNLISYFTVSSSYILRDGLFLRSPLEFLPKMLPSTFETLFTPSFRRMGRAFSSWTDLASRRRDWKARDTPAKFSAALTS